MIVYGFCIGIIGGTCCVHRMDKSISAAFVSIFVSEWGRLQLQPARCSLDHCLHAWKATIDYVLDCQKVA
jgi:hypothetical protein